LKEEIIIITNNSNKKMILKKISKNKLLLNIKFYSFNFLKKKLYFDYDYRGLEYLIKKFKINVNIAKTYFRNMYFLKDLKNDKIKFLQNLKKELEDNNLLIKDDNFKEYIKDKKIIVYGYYNLTNEEKIILSNFNNVIYKNREERFFYPKVYEAKTMEEEVSFVAYKICELLEKGINICDIKIIIDEDYKNVVKRIFDIYNIPVNIKFNNAFYSTFIAQEFIKNYDEMEIKDNINLLSEKYRNVNDLISIVNKSVLVKDKNIRKELIINDFKETKLQENVYDKAIECCELDDDFKDSDYVFLMGFNINFYPRINKDDDFLSDKIKASLGLLTSIELNRLRKDNIKKQVKNIKNLLITYKKESSKGSFYPSIIINELDLEVSLVNIKKKVSYSKLNTKLAYAKDLDNLYKFNMISEELGLYQNSINIPYLTYDNSFKGINNDLQRDRMNHELNLAYTNLEMYNECAFKYYLSKILKIDSFQNSFKTIIGNVTHHVLELGIEKEIDIPVLIMKFIKDNNYLLNKKEFFYLEKLALELTEILNIIKKQNESSKLNKYLFESDLYVYRDVEDMKITFKGQFDKVMYNKIDGKNVLAVVDYKTGDTIVSLDNLKYGLNMQLPIYLYLLKKSDRFKDAEIAGFYIQKVLSNIPQIEDNKSLYDIKWDNMKLQGFTNSSTSIISLIDNNYSENKILKNLKYKKNGELDSRSKVLSNKEMDELTSEVENKILECENNIIAGNFNINPKVIKGKNIACTYCKFKDICFMNKKDEVVLGGEDDEVDGGTTRSD